MFGERHDLVACARDGRVPVRQDAWGRSRTYPCRRRDAARLAASPRWPLRPPAARRSMNESTSARVILPPCRCPPMTPGRCRTRRRAAGRQATARAPTRSTSPCGLASVSDAGAGSGPAAADGGHRLRLGLPAVRAQPEEAVVALGPSGAAERPCALEGSSCRSRRRASCRRRPSHPPARGSPPGSPTRATGPRSPPCRSRPRTTARRRRPRRRPSSSSG